VEINERADIDTSQIEDRRSGGGGLRGGGAGIPIPIPSGKGGWIGLVVTVLLLLLGGGFGVNQITGGGGDGDTALNCDASNPNRFEERDCRNALYINSVQDYWQTALPERFGKPYRKAKTVFFAQAVQTGCGSADAGVGPFYCPPDQQVYIDLSFFDLLASRFGARGEFAQPYVLAHEYGHHIQTLLGTEAQMRRAQQRDPGNANQYSVMLELQADCYAGVWAGHATETKDMQGDPFFSSITDQDINEGLEAAAAVGDDAIQKKSGGGIDESQFTHGTSAQRQQWFKRGFDTGDPKACDTFGNAL
jgi:predicted metalloprotease